MQRGLTSKIPRIPEKFQTLAVADPRLDISFMEANPDLRVLPEPTPAEAP